MAEVLKWMPDKGGAYAFSGWPTNTYRIAYMPYGKDASPLTSWHAHYEPHGGEPVALTQRPVEVEAAKRVCEQHFRAAVRRSAWERYMQENDPPSSPTERKAV